MKAWILNRLDCETGTIRTGYEETLVGTENDVERAYRDYHEIPDDEVIRVEEVELE